jgi:hypothetical protein
MPTKEKLQKVLLCTLIAGLFLYHLTNLCLEAISGDPLILIKLAQILALAISTTLFLNSRAMSFLTGDTWIAGRYEGTSQQVNQGGDTPERNTFFDIRQSVFQITLTGETKENGKILYTWHGQAYDCRDDIYMFGLTVTDLLTGTTEFGVLQLRYSDEELKGTYHSGNAKEPGCFRENAKRQRTR